MLNPARHILALALPALATPALAQPTFTELGLIPGAPGNEPAALSADGSIAVGSAYVVNDTYHAIRWTADGETHDINLPSYFYTQALGANRRGTLIVGTRAGELLRWDHGSTHTVTPPPGWSS